MKAFYTIIIISILIIGGCRSPQKEPVAISGDEFYVDLNQEKIDKKSKWIDDIFERLHKRHGFHGAVLYVERGNLIYKKAFGYADIRDKKPITLNSAFQLASVSKMFTAIAIMTLYENGYIDYDEDIRKYIPEFPYEDITVRMLLTHRSGLPRYMSVAHDHWKDKRYPLTNDEMLNLFIKHKPHPYFKPNNGFHYCNTNYALLANLVEQISNKPFDVFIKETIFEPLKMDSSFILTMPKDSMIAAYITKGIPAYRYRGWRPVRQRNDYLNGVVGDKGVYTSINDLFKFEMALYEGSLLKKETLAEAFKKGSPDSRRRKDNYGFGWRIRNSMDSTVYHYGWWKSFRAFYIRDMKNEKTIIVLTNREKGPGSNHFWGIIKNTENDLYPLCWINDSLIYDQLETDTMHID